MKKLIALCLIYFAGYVVNAQQKTTLTIGEVYDFEVGDEFHIRTLRGPGGSANHRSPNAQRYIITGKTYSLNNDSVCYTKDHFDYTTEPNIPLQYHYNFYTAQMCFTHLDSVVQTLVQFDTLALPLAYYSSLKPDSNYCDSLVFSFRWSHNAYQLDNSYGKGIGHVFHSTNDMGNHPPFYHDYQLFYFNKGGAGCGTPDNTTLNVENMTSSAADWMVYPNPVTHTLRILNQETPTSDARFFLMDFSGRTVAEIELNAGNQLWTLDVSGLSPGQYLGRIVAGNGSSYTLKILKL